MFMNKVGTNELFIQNDMTLVRGSENIGEGKKNMVRSASQDVAAHYGPAGLKKKREANPALGKVSIGKT